MSYTIHDGDVLDVGGTRYVLVASRATPTLVRLDDGMATALDVTVCDLPPRRREPTRITVVPDVRDLVEASTVATKATGRHPSLPERFVEEARRRHVHVSAYDELLADRLPSHVACKQAAKVVAERMRHDPSFAAAYAPSLATLRRWHRAWTAGGREVLALTPRRVAKPSHLHSIRRRA